VRPGAHAEFVAVPSSWLSEKPAELSMEQAAVVGVPYLAAWQSLVEAGHIQKGERLLITGAGGAVGSAATQIAHWKGAVVLAADISHGPPDTDVFLNLKETELVSSVKQATGGKGVDKTSCSILSEETCFTPASARFGLEEDKWRSRAQPAPTPLFT
jgi:NADPH:quinone reductase